MIILYIFLGFICFLVVLGLIFAIEDYFIRKKYIPLKLPITDKKQRDYVTGKIRYWIKGLGEQKFSLVLKVPEVMSKGYTEKEAVEILGIDKIGKNVEELSTIREELLLKSDFEQSEIDNINKVLSGMKLRLKIFDQVSFIPKKK